MSEYEPGRLLLAYVCEHALLDQSDLARICERFASAPCEERYTLCRLSVERLSTSMRARITVLDQLRRTESVPGLQQLLDLGAIEHIRRCTGARLLVADGP